ncbi:EEF1AKMT1 [Mytilus edulis]|uniref:Protein-lysine N-methyltransferase MEDL_53006 n=1 Tax=Mytilus edulis TaxID=6550 RepID=A0A8S3U3N5_MYTED|nr:EEF1AKMT1 [Mytilus edulis]
MDDDAPQLSAHTLAALQEFYTEQNKQEQTLIEAQQGNLKELEISEDWQLSQFWYNETTATRLAEEALRAVGEQGSIACLSSPTAYKKLRELKPDSVTLKCLEYDTRFQVYGDDFLLYDYKEPLKFPKDWKNWFDLVIADPPFLSEECLCKTAVSIKYLAKDKIILCTGAVMTDLADKLLGLKPCVFQPQHTNNLQNEFRCYTNYDSQLFNKS